MSAAAKRREAAAFGAASFLALLALWQGAVSAGWANPFFVSSPVMIAREAATQIASGALDAHLGASLVALGLALGLAAAVGVGLGLAAGWFRDVEAALEPFIWFKYSTPTIAFYPILVAWLGYGRPTVVAVAFLFALTPIYANTLAGLKGVDRDILRAARAFGARPADIFLKVALPAAVPTVVAGLRLGVGRALSGVVVAELFGSDAGLGFAIAYHAQLLQTTKMMVPVVTVVLLGVALTQILAALESRASRWRPS